MMFYRNIDWCRQLAGTSSVTDVQRCRAPALKTRSLLGASRNFRLVVAAEAIVPPGQQPQVSPPSFFCVGAEPIGACLRDHDEVGPFDHVKSSALEPVDLMPQNEVAASSQLRPLRRKS